MGLQNFLFKQRQVSPKFKFKFIVRTIFHRRVNSYRLPFIGSFNTLACGCFPGINIIALVPVLRIQFMDKNYGPIR